MTKSQPWANPTPAGLVALAVACFCFFALLTGKVEHSALPLLGCYLIGGFVIQITVALIDLKGGNITGGNTFLYFSAYFMLVSGSEMFLKYFISGLDTTIDGWAWLCLTLAVIAFTPSFYKAPAILFAIVIILDFALPCIVLNDFKILTGQLAIIIPQIGGYLLLLAGILGLYLGAAIMTNTTYNRNIIPNPKPLYKENISTKNIPLDSNPL